MEIVEIRKDRGEQLCDLLDDELTAKTWTGEVASVDTEMGGDSGVVELHVAKDVKIATWNNGASDIGDDTLIEVGSDLWDSIKGLDEGDRVEFSGHFVVDDDDCVRESSLIDENGVLTPTFVFKFDAVEKVDD